MTDPQAKERSSDYEGQPKMFGMARRGQNAAMEDERRRGRLFCKSNCMMDDAFGSCGGSFVTAPELQPLAFCPSALVLYDVPFDTSTGELVITRSMPRRLRI